MPRAQFLTTLNLRRDHEALYFSRNHASPERLRNRFGGARCRRLQSPRVPCFDLGAQRRALAVPDCRKAGAWSLAPLLNRYAFDARKAGRPHFALDPLKIVIPVRHSREESW